MIMGLGTYGQLKLWFRLGYTNEQKVIQFHNMNINTVNKQVFLTKILYVVLTGSEPGFYQWFRGVQMRASLDLVLDWGHAAGLGELALEHTHTLSSAINVLATPRKNLLQVNTKPTHF